MKVAALAVAGALVAAGAVTSFLMAAGSSGGITLTKVSETGGTITFSYNLISGAIGYRYSSSASAKFSNTWDPTRNTVKFSKTNSYKVEAVGLLDDGTYETSTSPPPDTQPPAKPTLNGPSQITENSITFSWNPGTDNVGVDHYNVYKGMTANAADQTKVAEVNVLTYTYLGLACNTDYSLGLEVVDAAGNKSQLEQAIWFPVHTLSCTGPPPPPGDRYVQTSGSDSNTCTQAAPCKTYNRAYQAAQCGDTVLVGAGNYPSQFLLERARCATPITIQGIGSPYAPIIWFGNCQGCPSQNSPDDLILRGLHTDGVIMWGDALNDVLDGIDGGSFFVKNPQFVVIKNSDWGPCASNAAPSHTPGVDTCQGYSGIQQSRIISADQGITDHIDVLNSVFHDHPAYDPDHWECLWTNGGTNVTFRGNRIYNCQNSASIFFNGTFAQGCRGSDSGGPGGTWTFENNWFGKESNGSALGLGTVALDPSCNLVVRFNSFAQGEGVMNQGIPQTATAGRIRVVGNIIGNRTCINGVTYLFNVYTSGTCGTGSVSVNPLPYVNGSNGGTGNYHLSGSSAADNLVPASAADSDLATDYDGQARSAPRDAGSDEH